MVLGFSMAFKMAVLVISLNTMRLVFSAFKPKTSNKCQLMASPSRSSSDANHTVSASLAYFFNSATNFFFSSGTSYLGAKPFLTSMAPSPDDKSRMWPILDFTMKPSPRYFSMVFAFAGDSTMTKFLIDMNYFPKMTGFWIRPLFVLRLTM